jgi:hypothetical protein
VILQTLFKYLLIQRKTKKYPEMGITQIKMYYYVLISFLKQNGIIPNEEMMSILTKFFGKMIYQERKSLSKNNEENEEIDKDINFKLKKDENFFCFMKHCFTNKKYYNSSTMIKHALKEQNYCNIIIKLNQKVLKPSVLVKIKEYIYNVDFFSPKKIYKTAEIAYKDFYEKNNLNFSKLNIKDVRDCITNLIIYGKEMGEDVPNELLINTLYLLRNYEEKYQKKDNKVDITNIEDIIRELDENDNIDDNNIKEIIEKQNNDDENIIETQEL